MRPEPSRSGGIPGPELFARYALAPNVLGYCGPADPGELAGAAVSADRQALRALARQFEGAWPYLELIAGSNQIADPLDRRVVEAYWVGNGLLDRVPPGGLTGQLDERFRRRAGADWPAVAAAVALGGVVQHSFHVFAVYPWLGLLRAGGTEAPLEVLDRCRIRSGRVLAVEGGWATVLSRPLCFDGSRLSLGPARAERARLPAAGPGDDGPAAGDTVSLHWDWVCDRLSPSALLRLRACTGRNLRAVNELPAPGPAVACDRA